MKTVLITGANRGLGLELAFLFSASGFNMILHCRHDTDFLRQKFPSDIVVEGDLRSQATIEGLGNTTKLDILINNAGVHLSKPFIDMTIEEIREVIEVNLIAPILLTKAVWPIFLRQNSGLVININSLSNSQGDLGESIYSASKAGLTGFSKTVQYDATRAGIRVLNLNIGAMCTDMGKARVDSDKLVDPRDVARAILGLCEDYPSMRITSADMKRRIY